MYSTLDLPQSFCCVSKMVVSVFGVEEVLEALIELADY